VVAPTLNNVQNYRSEYHLRSILNQNYSNFKVVIIDDASTDHNFELLTQFVKNNPVPQQIILVKNEERVTTTGNLYLAATKYCSPRDIMVVVDGDDELLGVNIFKVFNALYVTHHLEMLYSNYIRFKDYSEVYQGISKGYTEEEKRQATYRNDSYTRVFHLRSFRVSNFLKIRPSDLQTKDGQWFKSASDHAIYTPLLELTCGKSEYIEEYFYLYNDGNGNNDLDLDPEMNVFVNEYVRFQLPKYECDPN
jgi:glycosyltransferase involved in cell wall biosynthesis